MSKLRFSSNDVYKIGSYNINRELFSHPVVYVDERKCMDVIRDTQARHCASENPQSTFIKDDCEHAPANVYTQLSATRVYILYNSASEYKRILYITETHL